MDKQKEIEKMACDMCLWRHGCNDPNNPIDSCIPLRMAERAVEAGYGDVKEVQHRAEVVERALRDALEMVIGEFGGGPLEEEVKSALEQAEKELAERKGGKG